MSAHTFATEPISPSATAMAGSASARGRASWSGLLQLSLVSVPVKAYPAACTSHQVHFNQLHAGCGQRIRYAKHCPCHGPVDAAAVVRGYEYAPGQHVVVEPDELDLYRFERLVYPDPPDGQRLSRQSEDRLRIEPEI